jgi:histidyl-tRNA synthetase
MAKVTPLSGFPEWLPAARIVEQRVLDTLRETFELHGFASVETRAVEPLDALLSKGETSKEVYLLRRLQADDDAAAGPRIGLHFDLTVPLARYVLEHAGRLHFPFRRYQIQKVWRGERPQEGRAREFTQADIDVIGRDSLSPAAEVELPLVAADAWRRLPLPPIRIQVANRKVAAGVYQGLGVAPEAVADVLRVVDKVDKVGPGQVGAALAELGLTPAQVDGALAFAQIRSTDTSFVDSIRAIGAADPLVDEGLADLVRLVEAGAEHAPGLLVVDCKVARGLDYYTGTVYETELVGHEDLGSVMSGGRYDALATDGTTTYPGVGLSVGVTRLLSRLVGRGLLAASRSVPTCVLVAVDSEESRPVSMRAAAALRRRGIPTEVAPTADRYGRQIRHADRRGIPYVLFPGGEAGPEVRDIRTGEQTPVDPETWQPPAEDLHPTVTLEGSS